MDKSFGRIDAFPRERLARTPTPIDALPRLSEKLGGPEIHMKRDDCSGLAMGGNKARLLEFYFGQARKKKADTVLITGSVQSNYACMAAAAARRMGMACHIQLEERVPDVDAVYRTSGNVLLGKLFGATIHTYPDGEDEEGADNRLHEIAEDLRKKGASPYVIPLGPDNPPLGALGYVLAAREICRQIDDANLRIDETILTSGSGLTHIGLLFGLRALGRDMRVTGVCVRRPAAVQARRLIDLAGRLSDMLGLPPLVGAGDIHLTDAVLAPGYGQHNDDVLDAVRLIARTEGILVDPVYTGRLVAGMVRRLAGDDRPPDGLMMLHTGGLPILFAYQALIEETER